MTLQLVDGYLTVEVQDSVIKLVRRNCAKFRVPTSEDDIRQDIYLKLITPSVSAGTNYLQRFDRSLNSLDGFLSRFVYNHFCRLYARSNYTVERAQPIQEVFDLGEPPAALVGVVNNLSAERIVTILHNKYPHTSGIVYTPPIGSKNSPSKTVKVGETITLDAGQQVLWRSVANIFTLMLNGMSQEEVASVMAVSKGWVSKQVHKIRALPEVEALAVEYGVATEQNN